MQITTKVDLETAERFDVFINRFGLVRQSVINQALNEIMDRIEAREQEAVSGEHDVPGRLPGWDGAE